MASTQTSAAKKAAAKKTTARKQSAERTSAAKKTPAKKTAAKKVAAKRPSSLKKQANNGTNSALVKIVAGESELLPIDLVGERYYVYPPKSIVAMRTAALMQKIDGLDSDDTDTMIEATASILSEVDKWIEQVFVAKDAERVQERLSTPTDRLDFPHILELMSRLPEAVSANPFT